MTNNSTKEPKYRTITLTDRAPVRIREDQWPVIAVGTYEDYEGLKREANWIVSVSIRVRQNQDGRAIVYGVYDYNSLHSRKKCEVRKVGSVLILGADLPLEIKAVAKQLTDRISDPDMHRHVREVAEDCIENLPAEEL